MTASLPVHPFPARMASEIALSQCGDLPAGSTVLDPMSGSGTVLRAASQQGLHAVGFDTDPLSVLMAKVWTTLVDVADLRRMSVDVLALAENMSPNETILPWVDDDQETEEYVDYWFAKRQQADLRRLSAALQVLNGPLSDVLRIALSRIIVTKDRGASLGRDVSHSRPHRVMDDNDFPVFKEFRRAVERVARCLELHPPPGGVEVRYGDARLLLDVPDASVDAVITSPPYLNAIDYIRGHRLSLVWLGYRVKDLRAVRSDSIGAERGPAPGSDLSLIESLVGTMGPLDALPRRIRRMIDRYAVDLFSVLQEANRCLRPGGRATFVVGNSCLQGVFVENSAIVTAAAKLVGLQPTGRHDREIPPSRRYLPPPADISLSQMKKRMRTESVLVFERE